MFKKPIKKRHVIIIILVLLIARAIIVPRTSSRTTSDYGQRERIPIHNATISETAADNDLQNKSEESANLPESHLETPYQDESAEPTTDVIEEQAVGVEQTEMIPEESERQENSSFANNLVSPDFKAAMDSYEEVFNEYIEFMNEFSNSDNSLELLSAYMDYMNKYVDVMGKIDAIDSNQLSHADSIYYLEVTTRIYAKLSIASQ